MKGSPGRRFSLLQLGPKPSIRLVFELTPHWGVWYCPFKVETLGQGVDEE